MLNLGKQDSYGVTKTLKKKDYFGKHARMGETIGTKFEKSRDDFKKNYTSTTQP
jgi:hypothetical protein